MSETKEIQPTAEQQDCIDKFLSREPMAVNAYAGTGKTSSGVLMTNADQRPGTYVAFNAAIVAEAKTKFPDRVNCKSGHGCAFQDVVRQGYDPKKMTGNLTGDYLSKRFSIKSLGPMSPRGHAYWALQGLRKWFQSADAEIATKHVRFEGKLDTLEYPKKQKLKEGVIATSRRIWEQMSDKKSDLAMTHDGYLKLWALSAPQIPGDYLILDEAQDTNEVLLEVMRNQFAQVVCVGDRHQQIYEWRGALNAMALLDFKQNGRLSQSWRFGPAVAQYATEILAILGETVPLTGNPANGDKVTEAVGEARKGVTMISRTNARLIENLLSAGRQGLSAHVVGGVKDLKAWIEGTEKLKRGQATEYPIEFSGFTSWNDVEMTIATDDSGAAEELRRWDRMLEKFGLDAMKKAFNGVIDKEQDADVVLTTAHKSKGREWDRCELSDDLLLGVKALDPGKPNEEKDNAPADLGAELRLYYVAATRAKDVLFVPEALTRKLARARTCHKPGGKAGELSLVA